MASLAIQHRSANNNDGANGACRPIEAACNTHDARSKRSSSPDSASHFDSVLRTQLPPKIKTDQCERSCATHKKSVLSTITKTAQEWWPELVAMHVSVLLLIAIFVVLGAIDDTPLANWHFLWGVNPTTVIAILVSICKVFLIAVVAETISQLKWVYYERKTHYLKDLQRFDSASRGEWGSLTFIFLVRWRAKAACLGALLVLLALAFEPFAQQTIMFVQDKAPAMAAKASIPRTKTYDLGTEAAQASSIPAISATTTAAHISSLLTTYFSTSTTQVSSTTISATRALSIPAAGLSSIFPSSLAEQISEDFFEFNNFTSTLAYIYSPEIVPPVDAMLQGLYGNGHEVPFTCQAANCTWPEYETLGICASCVDVSLSLKHECQRDGIQGDYHFQSCEYTTPSGSQVGAKCYRPNQGGEILHTLWNSTVKRDVQAPDVGKITALSIPHGSGHLMSRCNEDRFTMPQPLVTECTLSWCSKSMQSTVTNGVLEERAKSSTNLVFPENACPDYTLNISTTYWERRMLAKAGGNVYRYMAFRPGEIPHNLCFKGESSVPTPAFLVNVQDAANVASLIYADFHISHNSSITSPLAESLYERHSGNLTADMMAIGDSMTNYIRSTQHSTVIDGTVWKMETFVRVRWLWLIYPCALVLLGSILLAITIAMSIERRRPIWKSSILATVFHGLSDDDKVGSLLKTSDMETAARDLRVRLQEDHLGEMNLVAAPKENAAMTAVVT